MRDIIRIGRKREAQHADYSDLEKGRCFYLGSRRGSSLQRGDGLSPISKRRGGTGEMFSLKKGTTEGGNCYDGRKGGIAFR